MYGEGYLHFQTVDLPLSNYVVQSIKCGSSVGIAQRTLERLKFGKRYSLFRPSCPFQFTHDLTIFKHF